MLFERKRRFWPSRASRRTPTPELPTAAPGHTFGPTFVDQLEEQQKYRLYQNTMVDLRYCSPCVDQMIALGLLDPHKVSSNIDASLITIIHLYLTAHHHHTDPTTAKYPPLFAIATFNGVTAEQMAQNEPSKSYLSRSMTFPAHLPSDPFCALGYKDDVQYTGPASCEPIESRSSSLRHKFGSLLARHKSRRLRRFFKKLFHHHSARNGAPSSPPGTNEHMLVVRHKATSLVAQTTTKTQTTREQPTNHKSLDLILLTAPTTLASLRAPYEPVKSFSRPIILAICWYQTEQVDATEDANYDLLSDLWADEEDQDITDVPKSRDEPQAFYEQYHGGFGGPQNWERPSYYDGSYDGFSFMPTQKIVELSRGDWEPLCEVTEPNEEEEDSESFFVGAPNVDYGRTWIKIDDFLEVEASDGETLYEVTEPEDEPQIDLEEEPLEVFMNANASCCSSGLTWKTVDDFLEVALSRPCSLGHRPGNKRQRDGASVDLLDFTDTLPVFFGEKKRKRRRSRKRSKKSKRNQRSPNQRNNHDSSKEFPTQLLT